MFTNRRIAAVPLSIAAALGLALTTAPAMADPVRVSHSDLDLTTASGQKELTQRVRKAAYKACSTQAGSARTVPAEDVIACAKRAQMRTSGQVASLISNANLGG